MHSLHATAYPWVHEQWFKTFDHQAYVLTRPPYTASVNSHTSTGSDEASRSTKRSARLATPLAEFPTDL